MKLNRYKLNKKLKEAGRLSWDLLIWFSKLTMFMFFLITAIMFWQNLSIQLFQDYQVNLARPISKMILIVLITVILCGIDIIKKLGK